MRKSICLMMIAILTCSFTKNNLIKANADNDTFVEYVNPFIGTSASGNTYPGAQIP